MCCSSDGRSKLLIIVLAVSSIAISLPGQYLVQNHILYLVVRFFGSVESQRERESIREIELLERSLLKRDTEQVGMTKSFV